MRDIENWLEQHQLGKYLEIFAEHAIGMDILPEITESDLKEFGIPFVEIASEYSMQYPYPVAV
jgi:hypothetical protein